MLCAFYLGVIALVCLLCALFTPTQIFQHYTLGDDSPYDTMYGREKRGERREKRKERREKREEEEERERERSHLRMLIPTLPFIFLFL